MATMDRRGIDRGSVVLAGLIAGAVFMLLEMVMVPVFLDGSPWAPPRMIAAIAMGRDVLPEPGASVGISGGVLLVALTVHFVLSVGYALGLAWIVDQWPLGPSVAAGGIYGLALYLINFYGFTAIFPWFAMVRNWVSIVAHIVFGVVAAGAYVMLAERAARRGEGEPGERMAAD